MGRPQIPPPPTPHPQSWGGRGAGSHSEQTCLRVCPTHAGRGALRPGSRMSPHLLQAVCDCISLGLFDTLTWLGYCNSTMNPIIYPLFMRDFKRALGRLLPCPRGPREQQPGLASPSVRTSHSGARPGLSLQHVLPLPLPPDSDSDSGSGSGGFSGPRLTAQLLLPGEATRDPPPPARATTTVNFFSIDRAEPELWPRPPGTPTN